MKTIPVSAGQRTVIRTRRHSSMVTGYHFTVESAAPGGVVAGTLEVVASQWIFPGTPQRSPLRPDHHVTAGMWNTFFEIAVIPEADVLVTFPDDAASLPFGRKFLLILAVVLVIAAAVIMMIAGNL